MGVNNTPTGHAQTSWMKRGDMNIPLMTAWEEGIRVECPDQVYDEARFHPETNTIILRRNGDIKTVLRRYGHVRMEFATKVRCFDCGAHHHRRVKCPSCGGELWSLA